MHRQNKENSKDFMHGGLETNGWSKARKVLINITRIPTRKSSGFAKSKKMFSQKQVREKQRKHGKYFCNLSNSKMGIKAGSHLFVQSQSCCTTSNLDLISTI